MASAASRAKASKGVMENGLDGRQRWRIAHTKTVVAKTPMTREARTNGLMVMMRG